ncbi:MAG TPA: hypothetical protein VK648_13330 [Gemmatimonadaceae bacterium]|nr:hypothetical protein [Gemmatimonadaceae bacterium]
MLTQVSRSRSERATQVVGGGCAALGLKARKVAQDLVFLATNATLPQVLLQARQRLLADHSGHLKVHVFRHEI